MGTNLLKINDAVDIFSENGGNNEEESVNDLLTDLRHFCKWNEIDFDKAAEMSEIHFNCESDGN